MKLQTIRKAGVLLLAIAIILLALASCTARETLSGQYSCLAADTGEVYIFQENRMRITLYVMGTVYADYVGTYQIKDDRIIFDLPTDTDHFYHGEHRFERLDDETIYIDGKAYTRG